MPISHADQRRLNAAEGYASLGMFAEAEAELKEVAPEIQLLPEYLAVRLGCFVALKQWAAAATVARVLAEMQPDEAQWSISLAYATRRAQSIEAARAILLKAHTRFPKEAIIPYNLACYDCQLGDIAPAKAFFKAALKMEPKIWQMALEDDDLKALWTDEESRLLEFWLPGG